MPPRLITQADRRGKRIIASPTPSASASGGGSEGEEELESEEEEIVVPKRKDKGKGRAIEPEPSPPAESDDMDVDSSDAEGEVEVASEADPLDVIMDEDSGSGEEERDEDDYQEADEDEEEEEENIIEVSPVVMRPPPTVPTPRAARVPAPTAAAASPSISSASTPGIKGGLRLRLNVSKPSPLGRGANATPLGDGSSRRPPREAAKKAGKKTKEVAIEAALGSDQDAEGSSEEDELEDEDELEEEEGQGGSTMEVDVIPPYRDDSEGASSRAVSPTKMTARQRAKGNADLQEILIALPNESSGAKKLILTDAERVERREEMARRRKRQTDQKMLDEQEQTINRLLRAQTGRSRNKIEAPESGSGDVTPNPDGTPATGSGEAVAVGGKRIRGAMPVKSGMIRWTSTVAPAANSEDGPQVRCRVGIPEESKLLILQGGDLEKREMRKGGAECGVAGCTAGRKYRSTKSFEMGGCSVEHLRQVNEEIGATGMS